MGLRTADEYRASLRDGRALWYRGKRVDDILAEPDLKNASGRSASPQPTSQLQLCPATTTETDIYDN